MTTGNRELAGRVMTRMTTDVEALAQFNYRF